MLRQFGPSTVVALLLGSVLAILLFVPVAAHRYRQAGRLRPLDLLVLLMVAVYFVALWSYTLVPVPENDTFPCVGRNLVPFTFIADIRADPGWLLRNHALLQVLFNVALFAPLGFFLRLLTRKGILVATAAGLGISLTIELTQLAGVWGLYHCAYRFFDVDDLIMNTLGAALGSLIAIPAAMMITKRRPAPKATRVTLGRRLVGIAADLMLMILLGVFLVIGWHAVALYGLQIRFEELPALVETILGVGIPTLVQLGWVLVRGQTLGEAAVGLEPVAPPGRVLLRRLVKFAFGVGGFQVLGADLVPLPAGMAVFVILSLAMVIWSRDHRGLSHLVAGMELRVEGAPAGDPTPSGPTPSDPTPSSQPPSDENQT